MEGWRKLEGLEKLGGACAVTVGAGGCYDLGLQVRFQGGSCLSRFRRFTVHTGSLARAVRFRFTVRFAAFL